MVEGYSLLVEVEQHVMMAFKMVMKRASIVEVVAPHVKIIAKQVQQLVTFLE
jgi:hypothetical protein